MPDLTPRKDSVDPRRIVVDVQEDPLHEATNPEILLGEAAVSGSLWTVAQVVVVKLASVGGTLILMHLLSPEEFGIATLAFSVQTIVVVLQPSTLGDVVLAQPRDLARVSGTAHRLGLFTSVIFAVAIVAGGPWVANYYRIPALTAACAWAAIRPLSEWTVMLPLTRLRERLRFKTISAVDAISQIGATLSSVLMAWVGCGFVSVILPQIGFTAIRAWFYRRASRPLPSPTWLRDEAPLLFRKFLLSGLGQYVHGGLIAITPLIVGAFAGQREVGWYTMAFALSAQINAVAGFSMGLVLQPIFAQMSQDVVRQSTAFLRACRVIATLAMPVCLVQAVLAPAAFRLLLPEKWAGAIILTQVLSLGQAFFFCVNPAMGLLKAQGRFGAFMRWQTAQLVLVVAGLLGAGVLWRGAPLIPIVLVGGLYHVISGPIGVWICVRRRGASLGTCLDGFLRPLAIACVSVLPAGWVLSWVLPKGATGDVLAMLLLPAASLVIVVLLVRRFDGAAAEDCGRLVQGILRRIRPRPANAT